ncbi:Nucleus export protein brr6 [Choanephora cucurbitarum]|uniref:Nucleus export protein brr6 n=1 Tax=Choanephora cucurbitarum TaxID=101091 RepID=A0A1C7N6C9_9FUNG|nr:Nucleus export protein brr6 [Choanephora cucurbitarum]
MASRKRPRLDQDQPLISSEQSVIPKDFNFSFIPSLHTNTKQFANTKLKLTSQTDAYTLTQRFRARLREFQKQAQSANTSSLSVAMTSKSTSQTAIQKAQPPNYLKHQFISYTILVYIQMLFNVIFSVGILYIAIKIVLAVKQDFYIKTQDHISALQKERLACTNNYFINHCEQSNRIPAIEEMCNSWEACMNRDVAVAQAKVSAEAIAEIVNSFVEPISYKTLAFFLILIIGTMVFSNIAFRPYKRMHRYHQDTLTTTSTTVQS